MLEPRLRIVRVQSNNISPELVSGAIKFLKNLHLGQKHKLGGSCPTANLTLAIDLRTLSEKSRLSRVLKKTVNQALSLLGIGSTTILTAIKAKS